MNEILSHGVFAIIAAMAAVTVFTRLAGYWMMGRVTLTPRVMRMLDALPGSVVAALIMPVVLKEGASAAVAMIAVALLVIWLRNEFVALACGIAIIAGLRFMGW
ncbi:AzlD domain-containing protein [Pseudorhodoplanes sp.]|uniref:AzlD family protein n=1 Tax=Pseudorhodoplanes sp. TaxID=1934341 RepID=UPI002C6F6049|nr:AzlD domain-containing protein [Pseudorhodoplanes sp.]HWV51470.1 AzlD domain-containing protein [Pseudorhodoplanes sp.]